MNTQTRTMVEDCLLTPFGFSADYEYLQNRFDDVFIDYDNYDKLILNLTKRVDKYNAQVKNYRTTPPRDISVITDLSKKIKELELDIKRLQGKQQNITNAHTSNSNARPFKRQKPTINVKQTYMQNSTIQNGNSPPAPPATPREPS